MVTRRSGLGRGLGALIPPSESTGPEGSVFRELPLSSIVANTYQPRHSFDEEALSSLVDSIRSVGVLQPVLVRQAGEQFELIAGERRCRAARRAGLQTIPALIQTVDDVASLERALVENLHREDLNALDEAAAYQQLIEDFGLTHEEVARRVGRSRTSITNSLRLFQLPPTIQRLVRDGALSSGHARAILMTPNRELQSELAALTVQRSLSVRALEELVRARSQPEVGVGEAEEEPSEPAPAGRSRSALRPPGVLELEQLLAQHLSTRVQVDVSGRHGRIVVDFADLADLERIYRAIIPER